MGADIHSFLEIRRDGRWEYHPLPTDEEGYPPGGPFGGRDYNLFGFLANVRNYSRCPVIDEARGLPDDVSDNVRAKYAEWNSDAHHASWLTIAELLAYDYDQKFFDNRGCTIWNADTRTEIRREPGPVSLREFLGERYFRRLDELAALGDPADLRMVFWFDN